MTIFQCSGLTVDFLSTEILDDEICFLCDESRNLIFRWTNNRHNQLRVGIHIALQLDTWLRIVLVHLDFHDIAEQLCDSVIMLFRHVAHVERRFILRKHRNRPIQHFLQCLTHITSKGRITTHHHHLVRITRRSRSQNRLRMSLLMHRWFLSSLIA